MGRTASLNPMLAQKTSLASSSAEKANSDSQPESSFAGFDNFGDQDGFTDNPMLSTSKTQTEAKGRDSFTMRNPFAGMATSEADTNKLSQPEDESASKRLAGFAKVSGPGGISIGRKGKKVN